MVPLETVTVEDPAVSVPLKTPLLPTARLPKESVAGETASCALPTPVPDSATCTGVASPVTVIDKVPVITPADLGANVIVADDVCPGASVMGSGAVLTANPEPVAVT